MRYWVLLGLMGCAQAQRVPVAPVNNNISAVMLVRDPKTESCFGYTWAPGNPKLIVVMTPCENRN